MDNAAEAAPVEEVIEEVVATDWKSDAGLSGNPQFDKFNDVADLAKSYTELEAYRGNSLRIPSEDAGTDQMNEFTEKLMQVPGVMRMPGEDDAEGWGNLYQQMGRPTAADGYKFDAVDGFSDPKAEGELKALAHSLGLNSKQASGIHAHFAGNLAASNAALGDKSAEGMQSLKGEWGQAFDHNVQMASNAAAALEAKVPGIGEYFDSMAENGYDSNMVRLMNAVAGMMGESGAIPSTATGAMTPGEAREKINDIRMNPDHPANNDMLPGHDEARKEVIKLYKIAAA